MIKKENYRDVMAKATFDIKLFYYLLGLMSGMLFMGLLGLYFGGWC